MKDRAARIIDYCRQIALMSEEPGRTTRRFLTPPVREVHRFLSTQMEALGMTVHVDAIGNFRGIWQPMAGSRLILGSHIDSVPDAGTFDGVLGVVMAIEWIRIAQELNLRLPIEVIAFSEEEGVRFGVPFLGSRAVAGRFDLAILALKDTEGITVDQAIRNFGLDPGKHAEAAIKADTLGFVEIHIEQGPVLEIEDLSVAAVTAIVGQTRLTLEFTGQANHAGTTPMHLRLDALAGAAEWISAAESLAQQTEGLVATVGRLILHPNAVNVVPGIAAASLDLRHSDDAARKAAAQTLLAEAQAIATKRGLSLECSSQMDQPAVPMDERLTAFLAEAMEAEGLPPTHMPSGAGHDAMVMAARMPAAILFLRSPGGISHHPSESVRQEDVEAALNVGRAFLQRIAAENRS